MKKIIVTIISFFLIICFFPTNNVIHAEAKAPLIVEVQQDTLLLDDGTIWFKSAWAATGYEKVKLDSVSIHSILGTHALTSKGELISWNSTKLPSIDKSQSNIKQLAFDCYLKNDGTVWGYDGKQEKKLKNVALIDSTNKSFAYVNTDGEIYHTYSNQLIDKVENGSSIVSLKASTNNYLAYLDNTGKVVAYNLYHFTMDNGIVFFKPLVLATDAVHIDYDEDNNLIVTKNDGTVWKASDYITKFKLIQVEGLQDAVKATPYRGSWIYKAVEPNSTIQPSRENRWIVLHKDGSWKIHGEKLVTTLLAPTVSGLTFTTLNAKPSVGNLVYFKVVQVYNNGYKETLSGKDITLTIDKPHLLTVMSDGSYKTLGVGETKTTVTVGNISKSITISTSLGKNLTGAVYVSNTAFLPVQSVFKSLGGLVTYTAASKTYDIKVGTTTIQLMAGQKKVKINGKEVVLDQSVREEKGAILFPASLLSKTFGAKVQWETKLNQLKVSIGTATMTIESSDTPKIKKKEAQGTLVKYINKTFWVNRYKNIEKFTKLTITDITPVGGDNFEIVFKKENGQTLKSDVTSRDYVSRILEDPYTFLSYDPYKKYKWSTSTWDKIKASQVAIGMNKVQVELSWGNPSDTSKLTGNGYTIEVWRYGYQYVAFTNGIVTEIYSY